MTTEITVALAVAALIGPVLIAIINRPAWSSTTKRDVSLAVAIILGVAAWLITRQGGAETILAIVGVIQAAYTALFKPSGVTDLRGRRARPMGTGMGTVCRIRSGY